MTGNVSNQGNVNFSGGFLIDYSRAVKGTREILESKALNTRKKIFSNWSGDKNQVFYLVRNGHDYEVAKNIHINELKAAYFPNINTNNNFDPNHPEVFKTYIDTLSKTESIKGHKRIFDYAEKNCVINNKKNMRKQKAKPEDIIRNMISPHFDTQKKFMKNGMIRFTNSSGEKGEIYVSPQINGNYLVRYEEHSPNEPMHYYKFDRAGNIVKTYENIEILDFRKEFQKAVENFKLNHGK